MAEIVIGPKTEQRSYRNYTGCIVWQQAVPDGLPLELTGVFYDFGKREGCPAESFSHTLPPFNRMFWLTSGELTLRAGGEQWNFHAPAQILLPAMLPFHVDYAAGGTMYYLHFSLTDRIGYPVFSRTRQVRSVLGSNAGNEFASRPRAAWQNLWWNEIFQFIDADEYELLDSHCRMSNQLSLLFKELESVPPAQARVGELADRINLSASTLQREIRRQFGESAKCFFERRLIQCMLKELVLNHHSVSEVSRKLGFSDSAYFHRFFRRCFNMTPGEYRKRNAFESDSL